MNREGGTPSRLASSEPVMRAVHVGFQIDRSGRGPEALLEAWPALTDFPAAAASAGVEVAVVQAAVTDADAERNGVPVRFVGAGGWPFRGTRRITPRGLQRLAGRVAAFGPDVLHVQGLSFPVETRILRRLLGGVPVLVQHRADGVPTQWRRWLHGWGRSAISGAAFTAAAQARPYLDAGVLPAGVHIFEVPGTTSRFTPSGRDAARERTGLNGDPCVLWLGRLDENKDPWTVLDAVALASTELPGIRVWFHYGDAPLLERVRAHVAAVPALAGRVHFMGTVPHARVEDLCRAADILVSASRSEAVGFAVLEAMACGAVPIITDIDAFRALTGDGAVGTLYPCGDRDALARALIERSREDREAARTAVRAHFEAQLSFAAVGRRLREAYASLLVAAPGAAQPRELQRSGR